MDSFPHQEYASNSDCFFSQLLKQCSNSHDQAGSEHLDNFYLFDRNQEKRKKSQIVEQQIWEKIQEQEQATEVPEINLKRAKSLRQEQQRKLRNFMELYGCRDKNQKNCPLYTYSPNKTKMISKKKK